MLVWLPGFVSFMWVFFVCFSVSPVLPPPHLFPMQMILDSHNFPKFFVPEEKDTEKGWGIREVERTVKGKKGCHRCFHTLQLVGLWVWKKTKTRGGVSDHTGEEGKEAEGKDHWATSNDYSTTTVGCWTHSEGRLWWPGLESMLWRGFASSHSSWGRCWPCTRKSQSPPRWAGLFSAHSRRLTRRRCLRWHGASVHRPTAVWKTLLGWLLRTTTGSLVWGSRPHHSTAQRRPQWA